MTTIQKFGFSFVIALSFHLALVALFGIDFGDDDVEQIKKKPLPEIIQASILDDDKIMEEANRLKTVEENKKVAQIKQQQVLDNKRENEQKLLQDTKEKRLKAEKAVKDFERKRTQRELKEKQRLTEVKKLKAKEVARQEKVNQLKAKEAARQEKVNQLKAKEAARLAKIKEQKIAEKQRKETLRKAQEEKREKERLAKEKIEQEKIAKQKADAEKRAAALRKQVADAKAKEVGDRQIRISTVQKIHRKVNSKWIRPLVFEKGSEVLVRVNLLPSGDVMDVAVIKSSGNIIFDRSAENAVRKASPLPVPNDRALFTRNFRRFTFTFKPE